MSTGFGSEGGLNYPSGVSLSPDSRFTEAGIGVQGAVRGLINFFSAPYYIQTNPPKKPHPTGGVSPLYRDPAKAIHPSSFLIGGSCLGEDQNFNRSIIFFLPESRATFFFGLASEHSDPKETA